MPPPGRRAKPKGQARNHGPLVDWLEVPNVKFEGAPKLPAAPGKVRRGMPSEIPEPPRPLGAPGLALWNRAWRDSWTPPDADNLLQLCEQTDERVSLRVRVLRDGDRIERQLLRQIDEQVRKGVEALDLAGVDRHPSVWPAATKRWWKAISRMPHCATWDEAEWQYAFDTACLVAAFHGGDLRLATEIRLREVLMGNTADARRALKIRYLDPDNNEVDDAETTSVTAMDDYRRMVNE